MGGGVPRTYTPLLLAATAGADFKDWNLDDDEHTPAARSRTRTTRTGHIWQLAMHLVSVHRLI